jgi:hypothetical protein
VNSPAGDPEAVLEALTGFLAAYREAAAAAHVV